MYCFSRCHLVSKLGSLRRSGQFLCACRAEAKKSKGSERESSKSKRTMAAVAAADAADAVHPMVPVPDALLTVLRETARSIVEESSSSSSPSSSSPTTATVRLHSDDGTPQYQSIMGRILAEDVTVNDPYPPFDASIMDGYAVKSADLSSKGADNEWTHQIVGQIYAGDDVDESRQQNHQGTLPSAAYVTTGAVVPSPYDAVVPIEDITVSPDGKFLRVNSEPTSTSPGKWIRKVGCDMAAGSVALSAGTVLQPPHVGILIQVGVNELVVRDLPKVGVLSTGNEILPSHHHPSASGKIPDVNRPILLSTLSSWGNCTPIDLGIETDDDINELTNNLRSAMDRCDVIVTTGGISMGEKDVMEDVLVQKFGAKVHFGRIHMKPGKPTTFMTIKVPGVDRRPRTCLIFCLPGNPVSGIVCSHLFVRPCLDMLVKGVDTSASLHDIVQSATVQEEIVATLTKDVKLDVERPEYRRVSLTYVPGANGGQFLASSTGVQRSSRLMSMNGADGLMLLPKGEPGGKLVAKEGEAYPVMLLGGSVGTVGVKVRDSIHISQRLNSEDKLSVVIANIVVGDNSERKMLDMVGPDATELTHRAAVALGSDCFNVLATVKLFDSDGQAGLLGELWSLRSDVVVVVCSGTSFQANLDYASTVRSFFVKEADAIALQARKGAAEQHPTAALFEFTAGFFEDFHGMQYMLLLLPEEGLEGSLQAVGGLLSHALKVGKGGGSFGHSHAQHHHHAHK